MTKPPKPPTPGLRERILSAETIEEVVTLAGQAVTLQKASDKTLRLINRAAEKRKTQLSKP